MLPSEALKKIFKIQEDIQAMRYYKDTNRKRLEEAYKEFDEAFYGGLLNLIKESKSDDDHHERLAQSWLDDPEYKKTLHQHDHEVNKSNKGDK